MTEQNQKTRIETLITEDGASLGRFADESPEETRTRIINCTKEKAEKNFLNSFDVSLFGNRQNSSNVVRIVEAMRHVYLHPEDKKEISFHEHSLHLEGLLAKMNIEYKKFLFIQTLSSSTTTKIKIMLS